MSKWKIDSDHSVAAFSIKHMMVVNIRGQFNSISGMIDFNQEDFGRSSVEVTIDVPGLTTGNKKRDEHLFSQDFFDVSKYPAITFQSSKIEKTGDNRGRVAGNLTIRGIMLPVTLDVDYFGPVKSPSELGGETTMGFRAATVIKQTDFGMKWNMPISGGALLGEDVELNLEIEADLIE